MSDRQACSALRSLGEFRFSPTPLSEMGTPWLPRQLIHRALLSGPAFRAAPPPPPLAACGVDALEHPAASSPATASADRAKRVRIVHPPGLLVRVRGPALIPVVY